MRLPFVVVVASVLSFAAVCGGDAGPPATLLITSGNSLYSVRDDGSALTLIAGVDAAEPLVFSLDGRLAAHPCRPDGDRSGDQTALCVRTLATGDVRVVTEDGLDPPGFLSNGSWGTDIAWPPDSRAVAFLVRRTAAPGVYSSGDIYVYYVASDDVRVLDEGEFAMYRSWLRWSPDSRYIATVDLASIGGGVALQVLDVETRASVDVSHELDTQAGTIEQYSWAPDASSVAFTWNDFSGVVRLYAVAPDGSAFREVGQAWGGEPPAWSPDGSHVAGMRVPGGTGFGRLYVMRVDGGNEREIAAGFHNAGYPAWSRDSKRVAFVGSEEPAASSNAFPPSGLYVVDADGGEPQRLTGDQEMVQFPSITWSPRGDRIFYTAEGAPCMEGCPPGALFLVPADGSSPPVRVTDFPVQSVVGWQQEHGG